MKQEIKERLMKYVTNQVILMGR